MVGHDMALFYEVVETYKDPFIAELVMTMGPDFSWEKMYDHPNSGVHVQGSSFGLRSVNIAKEYDSKDQEDVTIHTFSK